MLFNSYIFIFAFLPVTLLFFHALRLAGWHRASILALTLMSIVFYGWWNVRYLALLVPLMFANFGSALFMLHFKKRRTAAVKTVFVSGLAINISVLGYFKYANFFIDSVNSLLGLQLLIARIVLPLGISFYIFQKIAFLVDVYRGRVERINLLDYALFVSFFPQLIAGPIVHHSEILPQLRNRGAARVGLFTLGITIFVIGLAKKVLLADTAALYASPAFTAVAAGEKLGLVAAWHAALAYTAQLYFDFSGYSDMAIGAALMFGIRLPINFDSPYKAGSIIEFWQRWHITLSRFLKEYLYIPLGGNRRGVLRRHCNLLITMLLAGLWHGAGCTYVIWGGIHGCYLVINHLWRRLRQGSSRTQPTKRFSWMGRVITFWAVVIAWVFFRSENVSAALAMIKAMGGANGLLTAFNSLSHLDGCVAFLFPIVLLALAWVAPNTSQITGYVGPTGYYATMNTVSVEGTLWRPSPRWAVAIGCLFGITLMSMTKVSEFIYFQF